MSPTVIWEPAEGLAIARCQAARFRDPAHRATTDHPGECGWCPYPDAEIERMLEGFNAWAGWNERGHAYDRFEVRAFRDLRPDVQRAAITAAQDLTGEPWPPRAPVEPIEQPEPPSADAAVPSRPDWLGGPP